MSALRCFDEKIWVADGSLSRRADTVARLKAAGGVLDGGVPRDARWSFIDRGKARASLATLLSWDFDKVIVAHGACVEWLSG